MASVLNYEQAKDKALALAGDLPGYQRSELRTVRQAMDRYVEEGKSIADVMSRGTAHILPALGDLVVTELTTEKLRSWLATMAASLSRAFSCQTQ
jgi:hypothetical protein